jgi:hypothetical protein
MIRSSILASAMLSVGVSVIGCANAADQEAKANAAQAKADDQIAAARAEADAKARAAQAEADQKIADAQASFMKMREDYRHSVTSNLADLDKKINDIDAKYKKATGKIRAELDAPRSAIHTSRDRFAADFEGLKRASASTWDAAKAKLDKEWSDLKSMVDGAS